MLRYVDVFCPVGNHTLIGERKADQSGTFVCHECRFIFPVNKDGTFGKPIAIEDKKKSQPCGCKGCGR